MNYRLIWLIYVAFMGFWTVASDQALIDFLDKGTLFARELNGLPYISDFVNTYSAATLSRRCIESGSVKPDVYNPKIQDDLVRQLVAPVVPKDPFYTQYPPYYFAMVTPLSSVTMAQAWMVFSGLGLVGAFFTMRWCAGVLKRGRSDEEVPTVDSAESKSLFTHRKEVWVGIILGLSCYPMWHNLELGQQSLILFPCLAAFWYFLAKKRSVLAGVVAAIAAVKLQYAPALGLIGLILGGPRFFLGGSITMLLLLGLSVAILGPDNVIHYPQRLLSGESSVGVSGVNVFAMQNLRGQAHQIIGDTAVVPVVATIGYALSLIVLATLWWRYRAVGGLLDLSSSRFRFLVSLSILLFVAFSLHTHIQDYLFATISCMWLWQYVEELRMSGPLPKHLRLISKLCVAFPLMTWVFLYIGPVFGLLHLQPYFIWAIVMMVLCSLELRTVFANSSLAGQ